MCKLHCTWRKANVNHTLHKENTSCSCPTSSLAFEAISSKNESKVDVKQEYPPIAYFHLIIKQYVLRSHIPIPKNEGNTLGKNIIKVCHIFSMK